MKPLRLDIFVIERPQSVYIQACNQRGAIGQLPPPKIFTNVCIC